MELRPIELREQEVWEDLNKQLKPKPCYGQEKFGKDFRDSLTDSKPVDLPKLPRGKQFRTNAERTRDYEFVTEQLLKGKPARQIAKELSEAYGVQITQVTISKMVAKIREAWVKSAFVNFDQFQQQAHNTLLFLYREALAAWQQSKDEGKPNTALLREARCAQADIIKMFGLAAPQRLEIKTQHQTTNIVEQLKMYDSDFEAIEFEEKELPKIEAAVITKVDDETQIIL